MNFFKSFLKGIFIGIGAIAPGVSGGSIAVAFGIYDRLTDAISNFYKNSKEKFLFLLPLVLGGGLGALVFSFMMNFLFKNYDMQVRFVFIGLMLGTFPAVKKQADKKGFKKSYLLYFAIALALTIVAFSLNSAFTSSGGTAGFWKLLLSGVIIGFGTIIPGVSASFILIALGTYQTLLDIITEYDFVRMVPIGIGAVVSVLVFAKLINLLYRKAYSAASYTFFGLLAGSVITIIPSGIGLNQVTFISLLLAAAGVAASYQFSKIFAD